jgi:ferredoxin
MKAIVDLELCSGCSLCADTCPEVFEMGEDDKAHVIVDEVPEEAEEACRDAADECPEEAISIEE